MTELVLVTPEIRKTTLVVQNNRERLFLGPKNYRELISAAREGRFKPDPPAVLARMPEGYKGQFRRFVYNGNTRYLVSGENAVDLNGLIVSSDDEIPPEENLHFAPDWDQSELNGVLKYSLRIILGFNLNSPSLSHLGLADLLLELERQEAAGLVTPEPRWYRPNFDVEELALQF